MVDWKDPLVIQKGAEFYSKSLLSILGLYSWEIVVTFDFEKNLFFSSTRRAWRWHDICYLICRYSFLIAVVLLIIIMNTAWPMSCQVTYTVTQFFGNVTIGTASLNLAFRALAIWRNNRVLTILMVIMAAGHWFVLLFCITTLKADVNTNGSAPTCLVTGINRPWLVALYAYTMAFDTFIMIACLFGLWRSKPRGGGRADDLYRLLWTDGLSYFIIASAANALPVVFFGLSLNAAMDVVSTMVSACITTIVSCRAVQRLTAWGTSNPGTQEPAYKMSAPNRGGRSDPRKPSSSAAIGEHSHTPWSKRRYFPTEGDVHLSSAMFARTVYMDNENPGNGQQKSHHDGGVFSLQSDDRSTPSSPTLPTAWKQTPSITSESTGNDKDKGLVPYKPTTARVSEASEQPPFPTKPGSLYQTSESVEEDERESEYTPREPAGPPPSTIPPPRAGR